MFIFSRMKCYFCLPGNASLINTSKVLLSVYFRYYFVWPSFRVKIRRINILSSLFSCSLVLWRQLPKSALWNQQWCRAEGEIFNLAAPWSALPGPGTLRLPILVPSGWVCPGRGRLWLRFSDLEILSGNRRRKLASCWAKASFSVIDCHCWWSWESDWYIGAITRTEWKWNFCGWHAEND